MYGLVLIQNYFAPYLVTHVDNAFFAESNAMGYVSISCGEFIVIKVKPVTSSFCAVRDFKNLAGEISPISQQKKESHV